MKAIILAEKESVLLILFFISLQMSVLIGQTTKIEQISLASRYLKRDVKLTVILPLNYSPSKKYKAVYFNDGQDFERLKMDSILAELNIKQNLNDLIMVGIHANKDRLFEYGVASEPDYAKRGNKAGLYRKFMKSEFWPFIHQNYPISKLPNNNFIAGFSLGGLSAFDLAVSLPNRFSKAGVFSGSFWWRSVDEKSPIFDENKHRIMHEILKKTMVKKQKFWFEVGTKDEKNDRNKNGIIDAIDDTRAIIDILMAKGLQPNTDIRYLEIEGGQHNQDTWAKAMPDFLLWLYQK